MRAIWFGTSVLFVDLYTLYKMKKLHRIESREMYPVPDRIHFTIKLSKGCEMKMFRHGRPLKDEELGDVVCSLVYALNAAEDQIEKLLKIVHEAKLNKEYFDEYFEDYPEDEDFKSKYKIENIKDALFHAMMKNDEKMISKRLNELNIVTEKVKL